MDRKVSCLLAAALLLGSAVFVVCSAGEEANADGIEYLHGFVYEVPPQEDRRPLYGVTVGLWDSTGKLYETTTATNGSFTIEYNPDAKYISFTKAEYSVQDYCDWISKYSENRYKIGDIEAAATGNTFELYGSSGVTALMSRTNAIMSGTVTTVIDGTAVPISNAKVVISSQITTLTGMTNADGNFAIDCASGVQYDVTITAGGFTVWKATGVEPGGTSLMVNLIQTDHTVIFGLDLAHTLALFGLLLTILIALIAIYLIKKPEKEDGLYVINDIPPAKEPKDRED